MYDVLFFLYLLVNTISCTYRNKVLDSVCSDSAVVLITLLYIHKDFARKICQLNSKAVCHIYNEYKGQYNYRRKLK